MDITQCHINKYSSHDGVLNAECESTAAASHWHFSIAFTSKKISLPIWTDPKEVHSEKKKEGWMLLILMCNDYIS